MFDIASLDTQARSEAGVAMPIKNPKNGTPILDSEGKPVTITLLGPNSVKAKAIARIRSTRRAEMQARGVKMEEADYEQEQYEFLTGVTVGWSFDTMAGEPFAFSPDNMKKFWADSRWEWIRLDAWQFANADGNFLPS